MKKKDISSLTELGQRVLDFKVVLVKSQQPLGDVESVVSGSAGDGVRPSVQTNLRDTGGETWHQRRRSSAGTNWLSYGGGKSIRRIFATKSPTDGTVC